MQGRDRTLLGLAVLAAAALLPGIGERDHWSAAEGRPPLVARDMLATGRWLPPSFAGAPYLNKPPLYHGLVAACFRVTGAESEAAARFPAALAAIVTVLLVYLLTRDVAGRDAGVCSAILLLLSHRFYTLGRSAELETLLTAGTTLACLGLWRGWEQPGRWIRWGLVAALGGAIATWTKGPVLAALFPLLFAAATAATRRSLRCLLGLPTLLLVVGIGAAATAYYLPLWLDPQLRGALEERAAFGNVLHERGPLYYLAVLPAGLLPALLVVLACSRGSPRAELAQCRPFLVTAGLGVLVLSCSSSKQSHYLLPLYPHVAVVLGSVLAAALQRGRPRGLPWLLFGLAAVLVAGCFWVDVMSALGCLPLLVAVAGFLVIVGWRLLERGAPAGPLAHRQRLLAAVALLAALATGDTVYGLIQNPARSASMGMADLTSRAQGGPLGTLALQPSTLFYTDHEDLHLFGSLEEGRSFLRAHPAASLLLEWDICEPPGATVEGMFVKGWWARDEKYGRARGWVLVGHDAREGPYDLVVYGGTSAGVAAAVAGSREGLRVALVAPERILGGLSSAGLGATDIGNRDAIGGLSRNFYRRLARWYEKPAAWNRETQADFPGLKPGDDAMWVFEPHVAQRTFEEMVAETPVTVIRDERLDRKRVPDLVERRLASIALQSGRVIKGTMFVDATYEGDLLGHAGVTFTVGREANATYGETLNGVQTARARHHQFAFPVDPWITPGERASGLLPGIRAGRLPADGSADRGVQAYNFRVCLTDDPQNRIPFARPQGYDPQEYELLLRHFEAGSAKLPWHSRRMPNRKTDTNNNGAVSTDWIGMNHDWPLASDEERERSQRDHERYQRGLLWTLANHPRVPEAIRSEASRWGLAKDEFRAHGGWPHQIYVREGRRMVSDYVISELDCMGKRRADDPVGLAAYNMDSHNVWRHVDETGHVRNEGDIQVPPAEPYPLSYRSIVPRRGQCENLLVPVCVSSSHIAYGSLRMEPVFMILGEAAGTAAALAVQEKLSVQDVPYDRLRSRLIEQGARLTWKSVPSGIPLDTLEGVVVDDDDAALTGAWVASRSQSPHVGRGYRHDAKGAAGPVEARFDLPVTREGRFALWMAFTAHENRASRVRVDVETAEGSFTRFVNEREPPRRDGLWFHLGSWRLGPGAASVVITNEGADGHVIVDAIQALPLR